MLITLGELRQLIREALDLENSLAEAAYWLIPQNSGEYVEYDVYQIGHSDYARMHLLDRDRLFDCMRQVGDRVLPEFRHIADEKVVEATSDEAGTLYAGSLRDWREFQNDPAKFFVRTRGAIAIRGSMIEFFDLTNEGLRAVKEFMSKRSPDMLNDQSELIFDRRRDDRLYKITAAEFSLVDSPAELFRIAELAH